MDSASQESNIKLINEIGKRPCLYNKNLISYNRKSMQDKAWAEVGKCMGWKASSCKDRWRNLRCVYIRHIRKLRQGVNTRPYYLMDAMKFALPFIKILNNNRSLVEPSEENNDEELGENDNQEYQDEQKFDIRKSFESSSSTQLQMSPESPEPEPEFVTEFLPSSTPQIKNEDITDSSTLNDTLGYSSSTFKDVRTVGSNEIQVDISDVTPNLELQNDAKKMFLLSLLPDVYAMSDVQMRTFKREVLNIIGNIFDSGNSSQ